MRWRVTLAVVASLITGVAGVAQDSAPKGVYVAQDGTLLKDGKPLRAVGVNYYDAFVRCLKNPDDTSYRDGFKILAEKNVPFARLSVCGFWPIDWKQYQDDKEGYFRLLDGVVRAAEENNVGLVPSLFWYNSSVPDLVGESRNQWGNPESKTISFMKQFTRDVVGRYKDSPEVWLWEFGNEFDLDANLPNAAEHRPWVKPHLGTPAQRSEADDLTFDAVIAAFREFAATVRELDATRPISTGNSMPRSYAFNARTTGSVTLDTPEEFIEHLAAVNPDPVNLLSIHLYPIDHPGRFGKQSTSYDELIAQAMDASRKTHKPLFIGEFGARDDEVGGGPDFARHENYELITALDKHEVPLAALWVFDFPNQETSNNVTATNSRKHLLKAVELANKRIRVCAENTHKAVLHNDNFYGALLDFTANQSRSGNGFNPLQYAGFRGENLFRDEMTGLYFEHIFNGVAADKDISMFTPNNNAHFIRPVSGMSAVMHHPAAESAWGIESEMTYTLSANAVDMRFQATPTKDKFLLGFAAFMWASYMNHTRERRYTFYGKDGDREGWITFGEGSPDDFEKGTLAYDCVPNLSYEEGAQLLNLTEHPTKKFLLPFYFGLVDGDGDNATTDDTMAYIMMFDQKEPIRFALWNFIRDASGKADPHSPAWDWQWVIRNPELGKTYGYRARMLYKPFISADDCRDEYIKWSKTLPG